MSDTPVIVWFRQDLRLDDNPALHAGIHAGAIIPVYILDAHSPGKWAMGGASQWWLHHSLQALNADLDGHLRVYQGKPLEILTDLIEQTGAKAVYWNRCYEPWRIARDKTIKEALKNAGIDVQSFNGALLWEPHTISKSDGTPYKVFTPYYRKGCLGHAGEPRAPEKRPAPIHYYKGDSVASIDSLNLLPDIAWYAGMEAEWQPGEAGAKLRLQTFLKEGLCGYKEDRNRPDLKNVSRLSAHLHWGEISPHTAWHAARVAALSGMAPEHDVDHFLSELGWREFSHYLLYHFPHITDQNLQKKFDHFPWAYDQDALRRWQRGQTGYPIVDAGMRELWQTGYMHNRVRMIVGSFLVKHLLLDWREGERWFWDTLVDADLANNSASWQWIAGCGADAAPYFRIFNPITQASKFDPNGEYIRRFVPELKELPTKYLGAPWEAPADILLKAGVDLGKDYPKPVVDHALARARALDAFSLLKRFSSTES